MGHFWVIFFTTLLLVDRPLSQITSPYETRPRLLIHEGNMLFQSGRDRNITFSTDGRSSIFFGSLDLKTLPSLGTIILYQQQLASIEASSSSVRDVLTRTAGTLMRHDNSLRSLLSQVNGLKTNIKTKEEIRGLKRQIKKAIKDVSDLKALATNDYCTSRPCMNGARCLSLIGKFVCLCTDQFSGMTCSEDIDECELYQGTSSGCQNGATCVNTHGSFSCQCPTGFYGYRCTEKSASCNASSHALCGTHGVCIPSSEPGSPGYKCVCDPGFQVVQSSTNPQCQDIDECASGHACFPGVTCTNFDGGFRCGPCPAGYNGNGHHCFDVDECATDNGGCSTNPMVPCINTYGSFKCGPCPAGFAGDGTTCTSSTSTMCSTNPCHPLATCFEMPDSTTGFRCQCPRAMTGNGIGAAGCRSDFVTSCTPGYCQNNGLCMLPMSISALQNADKMEANRPICICGVSYVGDRCETFIGACSSKPCQNGGTCVPLRPRGYTCICRPGTEGRNCQTSLIGCDRSFTQESGTFKYPDGVLYKSLSVCTFRFTGSVGKVLNITFPEFDLENSTRPGCPYDNLTLWDGGDETSGSKIGTFCSCKGCPKGPDQFILTSTNKLTMKFRTDGTINAKGFTVKWISVSSTCGGRISGENGRIVSPNFPSSYGPNLHCQWIISTHPGKHYRIDIGSLTLRDPDANCSKDIIQIRDGERIDSPILFQRCVSGTGLSSDQTIFSSMPYLFIYFRSSDSTTSNTGSFSISYTAVEAATSCGGELSARSGIIQSPNYGKGPYFPDAICIWIINTANGQSTTVIGADEIVELIFTDFDVVGKKKWSPPGPRRTDRLPTRRHRLSFQHYYRRFIERSIADSRIKQPCEGDFVESTTAYVLFVHERNEVKLMLKGSSTAGITIAHRILRYGVSENTGTEEKLKNAWFFENIRDGSEDYEPLLGIYCGQVVPLPVVSSSSSMWIKFRSNGAESGKGFSASYTMKCGKVFRESSGKIQSPNFPNPVGSPRRCEYIIEAPETYAISVNFSFADFGNPVPYNCTTNYVELRSAPKEAWHNRNFCSVPIDRTFTANGGRFKIIFNTDGSMDNRGFSANFNTRNVDCGGVYNQRSGTIRSPRNGDEYLHNMYCVWYIEVPTGLVVRLSFSQFALEEHEDCQFDYVAVYESYRNENDTSGFMGRYCGERKPATVQSSGNTMVVIFRSDSSIGRSGFDASFTAVNVSQSCDRTFFDTNGYVESPGYPSPVTSNMECRYNIQVKRGYKILLTVENLTMPCNESYLEIKNGDSDFAPAVGGLLLSRLCHESRVESIKSQSNALYLKFKSEPISSMSSYSFRLKYQQIAEGCGGTLNAIIGGLSAPQFPLPSSQNVDCSWRITVAKGNIVSLRVGRFDSSIPPSVSCWAWGNRLEIRDGPYLTSPLMRRVCHIEESVGVFDSTSNELSVRYVHNSISVSIGFFAMYSTSCNNIRLKGFYGRLESPGYPGMSHIKRNCSWRIETSLGNTLRLHFTHFDVQDKGPTPCNKTYLQFIPNQIRAVADLSMKNYTSNNVFCNALFKPSIVYSMSNILDINFLAQMNAPSSHFALEWITLGCGGILTANEGKFTVDNITAGDVQYRTCEWTIKAPLGRKIVLVVENFVGRGATIATNCPYVPSTTFTSSSVHIFNGQDNSTGYPILSVCDFINGPNAVSITSSGNEMFVSMHHAVTTTTAPNGIVFAASYKFIESGCGGILTSSSGFISSPNYPNPYPLGTECKWLIKVKTGYTVQFQLATLDIGVSAASYDCTSRFGDILGTYVEIFDGQNASAPLLRRFCGSRAVLVGQTIASTENAMFVRFKTSATDSMEMRTGRGFSGNYSVGCGGLLKASGEKRTLESSASHFYTDCLWKIVAEDTADHVVLHVNFLYTPSRDDNCTKLYLKIYDGPSSQDSPLRTTLCGVSSPPDLISVGDTFVVALKVPPTKESNEHYFSLTFSSTSASCGGEFHSPSGYLSYPLYPPSYLESSYCTWSIHTAVGNRIKLFFESFKTEKSDGCSDFYLEIRESSQSGKLFGRFCGDTLPPTIIGYTALWIKFRSGENLTPLTTRSSFYAGYKLLYGGDFDTAQGIITSPWYRDPYRSFSALPTSHLANETDQRQLTDGIWWRIRLPDSESFAQLTFEDLRLDVSLGNLLFDGACSQKAARLEIYDGYCLYERPELECVLSKTVCGVGTDFVWTSVFSTTSIRLLYVEGTVWQSDFKVQWDSVAGSRDHASIINEACRGTLVASLEPQNLTSPGYPDGYLDNLQCHWEIVHPRNYSVLVDVVDLSIEPHGLCQHDRLVIRQQQPDPFSGGGPFSVDRFFVPFMRTPIRFCGFKKPEGTENPSIWRRSFPVTVEFLTDASVNFSGFSLQYRLVCGAHFQLKDGTTQQLTSPNYPNAYPLSTKCVWIIGGRNGRTLSVQFDEIQLESSDGCRKDYLKVINGYDDTDPILATYCGSPSNKPLVTSTSNFLYIEFVSDDSGVGKGFSLTVVEKRFGCDERVLILNEHNPKTILESPNFPDEYPNSLDCSWVVQAPPGHRIQFDLDPASFDLEITRNGSCNYDYIELYDGASLVAPLLGQFCDKKSQGSVFSTGSNMLIRFVTDETIAKKGFRAFFKIATCGGTILLQVGATAGISSPNYPQPYSSNNICEWKVLAPEGHFINVSFADIGLMSTPNTNCTSDYVEIVDVNATGTSFGRFCKPSDTMTKLRSTSDSLYIKFVSDPHMNTHGFKILLNASEEVCGGHFTESSGVIKSPMYPAPYPNKRHCTWHIDAPPGSVIKLTIEDLHMPENEMGDCRYDSLKVHDGSYAAAPEINNYCGTRVPVEPVYSSSDAMTLVFHSDISMNGRGFKASYVVVPDQGCGSLIQNSTKIVVQFTNKTRMYCHWKIVRPMTANSSVTLKFNNFQMHDSPKCSIARMTIFAEFMNDKQHDKTIHCGKEGNFTKTFYQPVIHVMLSVTPFPDKINESLYNVEFDVLFRKCGGILTKPGTIVNPGTAAKYEDNLDCPWLIVAPVGRLIETVFRKFHVEYQLNCLYDRLSLKSGPYASSTDIKTLCGDHSMVTENKTISATGFMYVFFHSDHSRSAGGFAIDYRFLDEACGAIQQGEHGLVQSPAYPLDYPNDQFCQWEIIVNNGFRVDMTFDTFDLQLSDNCTKDSLLIENWRLAKTKARITWDVLGGPYCGYQKPATLKSDTNHVRVTFKSDASVRAGGFNMTWKALCGFSYSDESGSITSPYFPSPYKSNLSCEYYVKPKLNVNNSTFYTVFQFEDFQLEDMIRGDCVDYLEIIEFENNNTVAKLCGNELPETVSAKGDVLLTFASDSSSEFRGFRLNYKISECGGQIFLNEEPGNRRAKIQTPTYPAKYQNNMECEWIISTIPEKIIDFEFTNMSIESHADCRYDFVELRDGSDVNATLMGKFCGFELPIVRFKSTSNKMYIRFYSDISISSVLGFQGIASPTYGPTLGCGGTLNVTEAQPIRLVSPSSVNSTIARSRAYARQLSCEWRILAPVNKVIKMDFARFSLEPANRMGRCYDYLEIYDGFLDTGPLLGRYCGNRSPGTITSTSDQMYLHFFTDYSIEMSGFEISIKVQNAECGRTFKLTENVETIQQTFTPERPFSRCRWLVETEPGKRIVAEVSEINVVDPSNTTACSSTYLEFSSLPKIAAALPVKECGSVPGYKFVSAGNKMALTFFSNGRLLAPNSFTVKVQNHQDCNTTINIPLSNWGARVTSPGYPNSYPANVTCITSLRAAADKVIHLYFANFTMEESVLSAKKCQYDNLTITEAGRNDPTLLCGRAIPPTYVSQSNTVDLKFVSDASVAHEGFDISVVVSDRESCGGNLTVDSGAITSPKFPSFYPMNIECVWNLRVAKGYRLQYSVTALDFGQSTGDTPTLSRSFDDDYSDYDSDENPVSTTNVPARSRICGDDADRLEIFAGAYSDSNQNLLTKFCASGDSYDDILPITNTVNGHEVAVKFTTTTTNDERGTGFRIFFKQVPY